MRWALALSFLCAASCERRAEVVKASPAAGDAAPPLAIRRAEIPLERFVGIVLPTEEALLTAPADAEVERLMVEVGDAVAAGEIVALLDGPSLKRAVDAAQADVRGVSAKLGAARTRAAQLGRKLEKLERASDIVSGDVIDETRALRSEALAERSQLAAELQQAKAREREAVAIAKSAGVKAPFAGVVAARLVEPGRTIGRGEPLLRIVGTGGPRLRFALPPAGPIPDIGEPVELYVGDAKAVPGTVERIAPEIDPQANLLIVEASLGPAAADLRYGVRGYVSLPRRRTRSERPLVESPLIESK